MKIDCWQEIAVVRQTGAGERFWEKGYTQNPSISVSSILSSPNHTAEYKQGVQMHAQQAP